MNRKLNTYLAPLVVFAALLAGGVWLLTGNKIAEPPNPYHYDISQYKTVPPELLKWHEDNEIKLGSTRIPQALTVNADGHLFIGFDDGLQFWADGKLSNPGTLAESVYCLTILSDGRIMAGTRHEIVALDPEFKIIQRIDLGEDARLTSLAQVNDHLFAADFGQRRVWRLNMNGTPDGKCEGPGAGFSIPSPFFDLASSAEGLWVVDPRCLLLRLYSSDFKEERVIGKAGMGHNGFSGCCNPTHIAIQADGSIITLEKGLPRVRIFEANGELREYVTPEGSLSDTVPASDLAVFPDGRIAVLDPFRKSIRLFKRD